MNLDQMTNDSAPDNLSGRKNKKKIQAADGFENLNIIPALLTGINRLNFKNPTPIQKASIPAGIRGDDLIAIALTGSGKTIAFGIPMLQRLSKMKRGCGLVIVPTRELAIQVEESLQTVSRLVNIRSTVLIGGASILMQQKSLRKNPRVIIATPGRLMDHMERRSVDLSNVRVLVLDEADRMLDMGFLPDIKKILKSVSDNRQTMLYSATMPEQIEAIAEQFMKHPIRIEADRSGSTPAEISHQMFFISNRDKSRLLALQLKQCSGPVLVFTRTKRMASRLTTKVKNMGFSAAEIHSDRSQGQRRNALEGFKKGRYQVLIATDIAARGIDVTGIELVVNYDMPANSEDYVHRIGRTGRAGQAGHAISFATSEQRGSVRNLERFMKTRLMVSALPPLPSEALLIEEADRFHTKSKKPRAKSYPREMSDKEHTSKRKPPNFHSSKKAGFKRGDSNNENSYWSSQKKNRPAKKRSMNLGPRRKKSAKHN